MASQAGDNSRKYLQMLLYFLVPLCALCALSKLCVGTLSADAEKTRTSCPHNRIAHMPAVARRDLFCAAHRFIMLVDSDSKGGYAKNRIADNRPAGAGRCCLCNPRGCSPL